MKYSHSANINTKVSLFILLIFPAVLMQGFSQENTEHKPADTAVKNSRETGNTAASSGIPVIDIKTPEQFLGISPEKAYEKLGAPEEVFTMRGEKEWQDDVVFYYKNHIYLFWFKNRVWQLRADKRFSGTVFDLRQGMERKEVNRILGKPHKSGEGDELYMNPKNITRYETGFPVRMKVFYDTEDRISDIYVYRGDF